MTRTIEDIWRRDGIAAVMLTPVSWVFAGATVVRNAAYDHGVMRAHPLGAPSVSVGNLSVGGTGKTPVSAWIAQQLRARGATPAILLRGYGDDEPTVHRELTPGAIVVANPDRRQGAREAMRRGATVLVLDDAFQHRRVRRDLELVIVAAEQGKAHRLLPAGPLREGPRALRRAQMLLVTRKTATNDEAARVAADWTARSGARALESAVIHLAPGPLRRAMPAEHSLPAEDARPLAALAGRRVLAISAIGAPEAFMGQLRAAGGIVQPVVYPDHHAFSADDVRALVARAVDVDIVVSTLKDAVKLRALWPRNASSFWYLSQTVNVETGASFLTDRLDHLALAASR